MNQKRAAFADLQQHTDFIGRHIGPNQADQKTMLAALGFDSMDAFIKKVVPAAILSPEPLALGDTRTEPEVLDELHKIAAKNKVFKSYIGMGYYDCHTPTVILRNLFENPAWYTAYTP
ncbi:MAG TPA: glycine dehydrogenase (aminomethyl-transferring), partial [Oxalobacteraceae bacterium]|nr:glycine dehydrogenase (aminomethyl-transferring) [Oxalobacteraceae bacterium]